MDNKIRIIIISVFALFIPYLQCTTFSTTKTNIHPHDYSINKTRADSLYNKSDFKSAIKIYEYIIENNGKASELYYNLGNCYYREGNMALAILNYERALKLDPSDSDIRTNLSIARGKIKDKSTEPTEFFILAWWYSLVNKLSISFWKALGLILFTIGMALLLLYLLIYKSKSLKYLIILTISISLISNLAAWQQYYSNIDVQSAIVTSEKINVKGAPSNSSTDLFILHSGARLKIIDNTMKEWCEVQFEEGKAGWVYKNDISII